MQISEIYFTKKYGAATDQALVLVSLAFRAQAGVSGWCANYLCQDPGQRDLRGDTLYNWDPGPGVACCEQERETGPESRVW